MCYQLDAPWVRPYNKHREVLFNFYFLIFTCAERSALRAFSLLSFE